jgi:putative nucleotidyltransferase with HDIG domain
MSRLDEILLMVKNVPPFPKVAQQVVGMLADPDVTVGQLAEVIQYDQNITVNVLKICNASYFGLPRKISSLDEGLVVIGHDILKDIIITSSSARFYKGPVGEGYCLDEGDLWRHSVATGIMAKMLVPYCKGAEAGAAFTSGLLHDIGKRFLSNFVADDFKKIAAKVVAEQCSFTEAEKFYLGATHAELGGMILQKWGFAQEMIEAVREHHNPEALNKGPLTAVVALSNIIVISMGVGGGADGLATKLRGEDLERLGISQGKLDLLMINLFDEMGKAEELFSL